MYILFACHDGKIQNFSKHQLMVDYKTLHVKSGNFFCSITFDSSLIIQS